MKPRRADAFPLGWVSEKLYGKLIPDTVLRTVKPQIDTYWPSGEKPQSALDADEVSLQA